MNHVTRTIKIQIAEVIIQWLREAGSLGNVGNLSQIQQYMEM